MKHSLLLLFTILCSTVLSSAKTDVPEQGNKLTQQPQQLYFLENRGQITDQHLKPRTDIDFKVDGGAVTIFIGNGQLHYQWVRSQSEKEKVKNKNTIEVNREETEEKELSIYRMDVTLVGANKHVRPITEAIQEYTEQFYGSGLPEEGLTVRSYTKVTYPNIYPHIDWVLYIANEDNTLYPKGRAGEGAQLKYDFVVHEGGNVKDIQLQYDGATGLQLTNGAMQATTPYGSLTEAAPYTYNAQTKTTIDSKYQLIGNTLSFDIQNNTAKELVIDPSLAWATYYGGTAHENSYDCVADTAGNIYILGRTYSTNNMATTGAFLTTKTNSYNLFLAKFNNSGVRQWGTYFNSNHLNPHLAGDKAGNIYLGTFSSDTGMATTGAFQDTLNGSADGLLVKFNSNGARQWATYYGSEVWGLTTDDTGNIIVISGGGLATQGAYQDTVAPRSSVITKFNSNGNRIWCTYYPLIFSDTDIACDPAGNVYLLTWIDNSNIDTSRVTSGAHQTLPGGGFYDMMLTKISADGSNLLWATLYGGNGWEHLGGIACDQYHNVYISGWTQSTNAMATTGAHQTSLASSRDIFIAKFDSSGTRLWGTYYGGNAFDYAHELQVGTDNRLYLSGLTFSANGIATPNAYKTFRHADNDAFFSIFNPSGALQYGTYFGGNGREGLVNGDYPEHNPNIALTPNGSVYLFGITSSSTNLATTGAYQTSLSNGSNDDFIAYFNADTSVYIVPPFLDTFLCGGDTLMVPYGVTQAHRSTNTFSVQLSNSSGSFASPTTIGSLSSSVAGTITCVMPTTLTPGTGYRIRIVGSAPADTSEDNGLDIKASTYPAAYSASANTPICSGDTIYLNSATTTSAATFAWTGPSSFTSAAEDTIIANAPVSATGTYYLTTDHFGCAIHDTFNVLVNPSPAAPTVSSNSPICGGDTLKLFANSTTSSVTYSWTGPMGYNSSSGNAVRINAQPQHSGIYTVVVSLGSCSKTDTVHVHIDTAATVNIYPTPGNDICDGTQVTLVGITNNAGTTPQLQWTKNGSNISGANGTNYVATGIQNSDAYTLVLTPSTTCTSPVTSNSINMTVSPILTPSVSISANPGLILSPWELVTFTATPTNGGTSPTYQWKRNGQDVTGATNDTWGTYQLSDGDTISVVLYSDYKCPNPDSIESNKLVVNLKLGVSNINSLKHISLYPNPNSGTFTLKGNINTSDAIQLTIMNSVGQVVHQQELNTINGQLNEQVHTNNLPSGMYLLQLQTGGEKQHIRLAIN